MSVMTMAASDNPSQVGGNDNASTVISSLIATLKVSRSSQPAESISIHIQVLASYNGKVGHITVSSSETHVENANPCAPVRKGIKTNVSAGHTNIVSEISSVIRVQSQSGALNENCDVQVPLTDAASMIIF